MRGARHALRVQTWPSPLGGTCLSTGAGCPRPSCLRASTPSTGPPSAPSLTASFTTRCERPARERAGRCVSARGECGADERACATVVCAGPARRAGHGSGGGGRRAVPARLQLFPPAVVLAALLSSATRLCSLSVRCNMSRRAGAHGLEAAGSKDAVRQLIRRIVRAKSGSGSRQRWQHAMACVPPRTDPPPITARSLTARA